MLWLKSHLGWLLVIILAGFPILLWFLQNPSFSRFQDPIISIKALAQIFALSGIALFSLSLILSGRFRFTEKLFGGMNQVYVAHHIIGGIAFILLLLHPIFIIASLFPFSPKIAAQQIIPSADLARDFGIFGLALLIALMVFTYYTNLPYQIWRFTHKFMGLAFFLGGLHGLLMPSTVASYPPLRYYLLTLGLSGLIIYSYRTLLGRFFVKRLPYVVEQVKNFGNQIVEVTLYPAQLPLTFSAGQFMFISFPGNPILKEVHPFSISSPPTDKNLRISVKVLGDFTLHMKKLKAGDLAEIEGPFGKFSYNNYPNHNQVWIAGGIGITPFLSMAYSLQPNYAIYLYYCTTNQSEAVYLKSLQDLTPLLPSFHLIPYYSKDKGRISATTFVTDLGPQFAKYDYFICGPHPMMTNLRTRLNRSGISHYHIHTEEFSIN